MSIGTQMQRAFTLIELLVVVAVISILAAIAVPNFLEAQTRAKVSRVRTDMRTVAAALEAYSVDWNSFPPTRGALGEVDPVHALDGYGRRCTDAFRTISLRLSTPVAYMSSASVLDVFKRGAAQEGFAFENAKPADAAIGYHNIYERVFVDREEGYTADDFDRDYGAWRLFSLGPAMQFVGFGQSDWRWAYDPTNGTVSGGYVLRTQFAPDGLRLAVPNQGPSVPGS